jgi:hypothetical protein
VEGPPPVAAALGPPESFGCGVPHLLPVVGAAHPVAACSREERLAEFELVKPTLHQLSERHDARSGDRDHGDAPPTALRKCRDEAVVSSARTPSPKRCARDETILRSGSSDSGVRLDWSACKAVRRDAAPARQRLLHFFYTAGRYRLVGGGTD